MESFVTMLIGLLLALIGWSLVIAFIASYVNCKMPVDAEITEIKNESLIIRGSTTYRYIPVVRYYVDDIEYSCKTDLLTYKKNKFKVGDRIKIWINAKNPKEIKVGNNVPFLILGVAMIGIAGFLVYCVLN